MAEFQTLQAAFQQGHYNEVGSRRTLEISLLLLTIYVHYCEFPDLSEFKVETRAICRKIISGSPKGSLPLTICAAVVRCGHALQ